MHQIEFHLRMLPLFDVVLQVQRDQAQQFDHDAECGNHIGVLTRTEQQEDDLIVRQQQEHDAQRHREQQFAFAYGTAATAP